MPWSEWIQPDDVELGSLGRFRTFASSYRDPDPAYDEIIYDVDRLDARPDQPGYQPNVLEATWTDYPGDEPPKTHIQVLLGPNNNPNSLLIPPSLPPGYPGGGVDFEYEAPLSEHLGWAWSGPAEIISRTGADEPGQIEMIVPSSYFTTGGVGYPLTDHPTYPLPSGTTVATFGGSDPVGTTLGTLPDPGPVFGFAIVIDVTNPGVSASVAVDAGDLYARVRYPRWRYWIEGGTPLRLIQRGDGLGMGSGRLFGPGTRQSSTRLFGAL